MSKLDDRLHDMLDAWEAASPPRSPARLESLCQGHEELLPRLRQAVDALDAMAWLNGPLDLPQAPALPHAPGVEDTDPGTAATTVAPLCLPGDEPAPGYRLLCMVGRGGIGEVWKAAGPGDVPVAVKIVPLHQRLGAAELRGLELLKAIRHPHVLPVHGIWQRDGRVVIAMELAERSLADRLHELQTSGQPGLPRKELLEYMRQAAAAVDFLNAFGSARATAPADPQPQMPVPNGNYPPANEPPAADGDSGGIQHRDIKPHNLLLSAGEVKLADFGLARILDGEPAAHTGWFTPAYAAPEFFRNQTFRQSDQYLLAVTYCQLGGGRLPFKGSAFELMAAHTQQAPDLSMLRPEDRPAVARALAKQPADRWPSCQAFVEAIETSWQDERPPAVRKLTGLAARRSSLFALAGAACVVALAWIVWTKGPDNVPNDAPDDTTPPVARLPFQPGDDAAAAQRAQAFKSGVPESFVNSAGMKFALIPAGSFQMGSPESEPHRNADYEYQHPVAISKPFYLSVYETTQAQYRAVMGENTARLRHGPEEELPVESILHAEAVEFCRRLSAREGKHYRLPTEAEWEYACRAGTSTAFYWGDQWESRRAQTTGGSTAPVGGRAANPFGLHDIIGNVWEWCADRFAADYYYRDSPEVDPRGPVEGREFVYRGAGWFDGPGLLTKVPDRVRSATRQFLFNESNAYDRLGFRAAMSIDEPAPPPTLVRANWIDVDEAAVQRAIADRQSGRPAAAVYAKLEVWATTPPSWADGTLPWRSDTGLPVRKGQSVRIRASGAWRFDEGETITRGPEHLYIAIGQAGQKPLQEVPGGADVTFAAAHDGNLFLSSQDRTPRLNLDFLVAEAWVGE